MLLAYNLTGVQLALAAGVPPRVLPISAFPPARGPAVDVTTELRPAVAVDPAHGVAGGLTGANYVDLQVQVTAGSVAFEWTHGPEYLTTGLVVPGPAPGIHAGTHLTGAGDPLAVSTTTATDNNTGLYLAERFDAPAAGGTNYVGQYAPGGVIDDAVGPFTAFFPPRNIQVVLGAGGVNPVTVTVDGLDYKGDPIPIVFTCTGPGTYQLPNVVHSVTRVRATPDPGGTLDIQTGDGFGLPSGFDSIQKLVVGGTVEAPSAVHLASGGFVPTTVPNGVLNYIVRYKASHLHTQAAHGHNIV